MKPGINKKVGKSLAEKFHTQKGLSDNGYKDWRILGFRSIKSSPWRIHVWYIWLIFHGKCRQIHHTWILWVVTVLISNNPIEQKSCSSKWGWISHSFLVGEHFCTQDVIQGVELYSAVILCDAETLFQDAGSSQRWQYKFYLAGGFNPSEES